MSLPGYPTYKSSGVDWLGEVPAHWEVVRIRRLFTIKKRIAGDVGYDVFSVTQHGIRIKDIESGAGQLSMDYSKYQIVNVGDFVMNHMDLLTGSADIASTVGVTSPDYRVFSITNPDRCHARYCFYVFQMAYRRRIFYAYGQGSSQLGRWRLPTDHFNDFPFPFPPTLEQQTIATYLDSKTSKIDGLVAEQRRLIALLTEKRRTVISHAVTKGLNPDVSMKPSGIDWLGEVPEHWSIRRLKDLSCFITSGPRGWSERVGEEGSLFIQSGDLNNFSEVDFAGSKRVRVGDAAEATRTRLGDGDVVVCITGAKTGRVAVCTAIPEAAYINQHLCLVRPTSDILPAFLGASLASVLGQTHFELSQYGLKQGLSLENVKEAPVLLPPLGEQTAIATFIAAESAKLDTLTAQAQRAIELLQERRVALISAAVCGKIDVRGLAEPEAA